MLHSWWVFLEYRILAGVQVLGKGQRCAGCDRTLGPSRARAPCACCSSCVFRSYLIRRPSYGVRATGRYVPSGRRVGGQKKAWAWGWGMGIGGRPLSLSLSPLVAFIKNKNKPLWSRPSPSEAQRDRRPQTPPSMHYAPPSQPHTASHCDSHAGPTDHCHSGHSHSSANRDSAMVWRSYGRLILDPLGPWNSSYISTHPHPHLRWPHLTSKTHTHQSAVRRHR